MAKTDLEKPAKDHNEKEEIILRFCAVISKKPLILN